MANDEKDTSETYSIRIAPPPEMILTPSDPLDIFAIKKEDAARLGATIGIVLGEGVFLCNAYRLDKRLSSNERGEIWKASDLQASRNVSLYLPPLEMRKNESAIEPMKQIAKRMEALDHPRIVPLLESFTDPEHGFFTVRKFVSGNPLDTEIIKRHGKLVTTKAVKVLNDIAHALDYAHSVGVVHGDLCPNNIIVDQDDNVCINNFALLSVQADKVPAARKPYLPPEIAEGHPAVAASDVYALAVITYELLSGRLPLPPESMDTPLPIPHVPSTVDSVIRKAMARDPDDRYGSCSTFVKALETSLHEPQKIKPATVAPSPKSSGKKHLSPALWGLALTLVLLMTGGIVFVEQHGGVAWIRQMLFPKMELLPERIVLRIESPLAPEEGTSVRHTQPPDVPPLTTPSVMPEIMVPEMVLIEEPKTEPVEETETPQPDVVIPPTPIEQEHSLPDPIETMDEPEQNDSVRDSAVSPETFDQPQTIASALLDKLRHVQGERKEIIIDNAKYCFRWCSPGPFKDGFWIQETVVTQELWKASVKSMEPQPADGPRLPMRRVSWNDCQQFIVHLNDEPAILMYEDFANYRFDLPTEEQWEYADSNINLDIDEHVLEWCNGWYDNEEKYRVVRGSNRTGRAPTLGYDNVSFRLVIVPQK
jgi:serine/threonine-protein kinase